jgi:atypical dual specificity phosphatase
VYIFCVCFQNTIDVFTYLSVLLLIVNIPKLLQSHLLLIRSIVTIKEKPLPSEWFSSRNNNGVVKIDYLHISIEDYGAPSIEELDYAVNYIRRQIDNKKPVMVHCSGGKGRTGTILAAYLIKKEDGLSAGQAIGKLSSIRGESIQSKRSRKDCF